MGPMSKGVGRMEVQGDLEHSMTLSLVHVTDERPYQSLSAYCSPPDPSPHTPNQLVALTSRRATHEYS